jgi:hypothetical protein
MAWEYGFGLSVVRLNGVTPEHCPWGSEVPSLPGVLPRDAEELRRAYLLEIRGIIDMLSFHIQRDAFGAFWITVPGRPAQRLPYDPCLIEMSRLLEEVLDWFPNGDAERRQ